MSSLYCETFCRLEKFHWLEISLKRESDCSTWCLITKTETQTVVLQQSLTSRLVFREIQSDAISVKTKDNKRILISLYLDVNRHFLTFDSSQFADAREVSLWNCIRFGSILNQYKRIAIYGQLAEQLTKLTKHEWNEQKCMFLLPQKCKNCC